jgi:hypothetical protein
VTGIEARRKDVEANRSGAKKMFGQLDLVWLTGFPGVAQLLAVCSDFRLSNVVE